MELLIREQAEMRTELRKLLTLVAALQTKLSKPEPVTPFLDIDESAIYCKLEKATLYNAVYRGQLHKQPGSRKLIFHRDDLNNYLTTRWKKKR